MHMTGQMLIGSRDVTGSQAAIRGIDPATNDALDPPYGGGTQDDVDAACKLAAQAFRTYRKTMPEERAGFLEKPHDLGVEVFGASSLILACDDETQMLQLVDRLEGQLTATLHMTEDDTALAERLVDHLELRVGRILVNGYPTGVEVCDAMVHGGPFPATSDSRTTSVGTAGRCPIPTYRSNHINGDTHG